MDSQSNIGRLILVLEDIEETRDGIEKLLKADKYRVQAARNEEEAIIRAMRQPPDLIVVSLSGTTDESIQTSHHIRQQAALPADKVPVVIFCVETVPQGEEVAIGDNVYLTQLDNFNQLRAFLIRLLAG